MADTWDPPCSFWPPVRPPGQLRDDFTALSPLVPVSYAVVSLACSLSVGHVITSLPCFL